VAATHTIPPYPAMDLRLGNEGTVLLRLIVGPDGRVVEAHVIRTSGFASLDRAAQAWVIGHWRYQPAVRGGGAAASAVDVAVKFSLKNAG
jgi:periplasmic protein TonB